MPRVLPELTDENRPFWTGGAQGDLLICFCSDCSKAVHPPQICCPSCLSRNVAPRAVSGQGRIMTYTINRQKWMPDLEVPFALAIVELDDAPGVRITAELIDIALDAIRIDDPVEVHFISVEDVWIPQFRPLGSAAA